MEKAVFKLLVRTPERTVLDEDVRSVVLRNASGEFQVLPGHESVISPLAIHRMVVEKVSGEKIPVAVHGGMVRVDEGGVLVLADAAELPGEIEIERARDAERRAEERLRKRSEDVDADRALHALLRARLRLEVKGGSGK